MPKTYHAQVILLIADGFDEAAVSIILTTLRQAGLAVTLVGLRSRQVSGAHGLVIVPNTSLDRFLEAPSPPILALILPDGASHLARLRVDPRVSILLQRSLTDQATLVCLGEDVTQLVDEMTDRKGETVDILEPEPGIYLEDFASNLVQRLNSVT